MFITSVKVDRYNVDNYYFPFASLMSGWSLQIGNRAGSNSLFCIVIMWQYFEEDDGNEYIYKELKVTTLSSIMERLQTLFLDLFPEILLCWDRY